MTVFGADALCWLPVRRISDIELLGFLQVPVSQAEIGVVLSLKSNLTLMAMAQIGIAPVNNGTMREASVCARDGQEREFWRSIDGFVEVPRAG